MNKPIKKYCTLCNKPVVPEYGRYSRKAWYYPKRCPDCFYKLVDPKSRGFGMGNTRGEKNFQFKPNGTRIVHDTGHGFYIKIKKDGVWQYEHRFVMEEFLGRKLFPKEIVHHINGKTIDNRIENLELFSSNGKHTVHHLYKGKKCSIKNCERYSKSLGFCTLHYQRFKKHGTTSKHFKEKAQCSVFGCMKPRQSLGFCPMHYERFRKHGDPLYQKKQRVCSIDGCNRKHQAKNFCIVHYQEFKRKGII